jgi:hypothetical protein
MISFVNEWGKSLKGINWLFDLIPLIMVEEVANRSEALEIDGFFRVVFEIFP